MCAARQCHHASSSCLGATGMQVQLLTVAVGHGHLIGLHVRFQTLALTICDLPSSRQFLQKLQVSLTRALPLSSGRC